MKQIKKLEGLIILLFWLIVWWSISLLSNDLIIPSPFDTGRVILQLLMKTETFLVIGSSLLRVIVALIIGIALGIICGVLAGMINWVDKLLKPIVQVIKATPVVSFIIILFIYVEDNAIPIICGILLCFPIIYNNVREGYRMVDSMLINMSEVYQVPLLRKVKQLYLPSTLPYLFAGVLTSIGICWKATIAAELIGYVKFSIGMMIHDGRISIEYDHVFAWTIIIIICSVLIEVLTKKLIQRINIYERYKSI